MIFNIEFIRHPKARDGTVIDLMPRKATPGSSGYDLKSADDVAIPPGGRAKVSCGFKMSIPEGWEAQVRSRSGLAIKHGIAVVNGIGTIDSDYRGEMCALLINHSDQSFEIRAGERIAQMVFMPILPTAVVEGLVPDDTQRGAGGFGSTGK